MVRRIPHSAAHGVQLGASFLCDTVGHLVWQVGHEKKETLFLR